MFNPIKWLVEVLVRPAAEASYRGNPQGFEMVAKHIFPGYSIGWLERIFIEVTKEVYMRIQKEIKRLP